MKATFALLGIVALLGLALAVSWRIRIGGRPRLPPMDY